MAERDISNNELADQVRVDRRVISRWRQPSYKPIKLDVGCLNRLCKALKCQPGDLLKYIPDEEAEKPQPKD